MFWSLGQSIAVNKRLVPCFFFLSAPATDVQACTSLEPCLTRRSFEAHRPGVCDGWGFRLPGEMKKSYKIGGGQNERTQ